MSDALRSERTRIDRHPERGRYDRATLEAILDEALVCHVGFVIDGQPHVVPASFGRGGEVLYVHGSSQSRLMRALAGGAAACVTVTLLDGLVLARSAFNHSMNYRSVVVLGRATEITARDEKARALRVISEHVIRGRWDAVRAPSDRELDATTVVALRIDEASAKIRSGPPIDQEGDRAASVWGGVLPTALVFGTPVADAVTGPDAPLPAHVAEYRRSR